jgi:hypothetical protein
MSEPLMKRLAELSTTEPEAARAERIKMACRARLARQVPNASDSRVRSVRFWQPLIVALGVAYLIGTIVEALRVYRLS